MVLLFCKYPKVYNITVTIISNSTHNFIMVTCRAAGCDFPRHVTKNEQIVGLCLKHYKEYNSAMKLSVQLQVDRAHTKGNQSKNQAAKNQSKKRRREEDNDSINRIIDEETKRIAKKLITFRKRSRRFVIVKDVIEDIGVTDLELTGAFETIIFSSNGSLKRSMCEISNVSCVGKVLNALKCVFPGCTEVKVKIITSLAGDPAQDTHTDYDTKFIINRVHDLKHFHYSAIVAIEDGTHLLTETDRKRVDIPKNSMIVFRGDFPHAGGEYVKKNSRIFISISCPLAPLDSSVYIVT